MLLVCVSLWLDDTSIEQKKELALSFSLFFGVSFFYAWLVLRCAYYKSGVKLLYFTVFSYVINGLQIIFWCAIFLVLSILEGGISFQGALVCAMIGVLILLPLSVPVYYFYWTIALLKENKRIRRESRFIEEMS